MLRVLITGASGFVGGAAWSFFRENGLQPLATGRRERVDEDYIPFDLESLVDEQKRREFGKLVSNCDVVLHAAARSSPWGTKRQFQSANVDVTRNLLSLCESMGRPRFVFVSSSSVYYREQDQFNLTEDSPQAMRAVNHYAGSKQLAEQCVQQYAGDWTILRPRAVYGRGDTVLFPRILRAAAAGRLPVLVRPDPPVRGDLILIDNLVDCLYQAVTNRAIQGCYNLTDGNPVEINAFLSDVLEQIGFTAPRRRLDVAQAYRIAYVLEVVYGLLRFRTEPPITRFGVHVFAFSKTFDVSKMLRDFGPPRKSTAQGVAEFVAWLKSTGMAHGAKP